MNLSNNRNVSAAFTPLMLVRTDSTPSLTSPERVHQSANVRARKPSAVTRSKCFHCTFYFELVRHQGDKWDGVESVLTWSVPSSGLLTSPEDRTE
jgi:hypothetical protein